MRKAALFSLAIVLLAGAPARAASEAGVEVVRGIVTEKDGDSFRLFRVDTSDPPTTLDLRVTPQTVMKGVDGLGGVEKGAEVDVQLNGPPAVEKGEVRSLELLATAEDTAANLRSARLNALTGGDLAVTTQQSIARDVGLVDVRSGKIPLPEAVPSRPAAASPEPHPETGERVFEETPVQKALKGTPVAPEEVPAAQS